MKHKRVVPACLFSWFAEAPNMRSAPARPALPLQRDTPTPRPSSLPVGGGAQSHAGNLASCPPWTAPERGAS